MFLLALRQRRFCLARNNSFTSVLDNVLRAEPVYVKGTGIRVLVTDIDYNRGQKTVHGRIKFLDTPTKKTLLKCEQCSIDVREVNRPAGPLGSVPAIPYTPTYETIINSVIDLDNLSVTPYETKAAKILYKKQK